MDELLTTIGSRLREARGTLGLSQEEVAARAKLNTSYLSQIERGTKNPSLDVLERVATAVGLTLEELFRSEEVPSSALTEREVAGLLDRVPEDRRGDLLEHIRSAVKLISS